MRRLSIAAQRVTDEALSIAACLLAEHGPTTTGDQRDLAAGARRRRRRPGIAYLCDGRKEVAVVYAKNRASVTLDGKTWRLEYQPTDQGFRYSRRRPTNGSAATISPSLREPTAAPGRSPSTAGRRDGDLSGAYLSQNLMRVAHQRGHADAGGPQADEPQPLPRRRHQ